MALSSDERALLLSVSTAEQQSVFERAETMLGIRWDLKTLIAVAKEDGDQKPESIQLPRNIHVPMLLAMAPEFFKSLSEDMARKWNSMQATQHKSGGGTVIEIGSLSAAQARDLFKQVGQHIASAQPPVGDDNG